MRINLSPPGDKVPGADRQVVLKVLGLTVALLLLANSAVPPLERRDRTAWLLNQKWTLLGGLKRPVATLVLGDSSGNQAVMPALLDKSLPGGAVNLCTFGNMTLAGDVWMLDEYLRAHGPPKRVVAVHVHDILPRGLNLTNVSQIPRPWGFWRQQLPEAVEAPGNLVRLAVSRYLPLYARTPAFTTFAYKPSEIGRLNYHIEPDGFMPVTVQSDLEGHARRYLEDARTKPFSVSPINRLAVRRLVEMSNQHGFDLYLANSPLYRSLYTQPEFRRYLDQMNAEFAVLVAAGRRTRRILVEPVLLDADALESVDHTNVRGAVVYTRRLVEAILAEAPTP